MSTSTEDLSKLQEEVKGLEVSQAAQAAAQAGTWSTMAAGMGGFVIGVFLGIAISGSGRR